MSISRVVVERAVGQGDRAGARSVDSAATARSRVAANGAIGNRQSCTWTCEADPSAFGAVSCVRYIAANSATRNSQNTPAQDSAAVTTAARH